MRPPAGARRDSHRACGEPAQHWSRRNFLGVGGVAALAGALSLAGCSRTVDGRPLDGGSSAAGSSGGGSAGNGSSGGTGSTGTDRGLLVVVGSSGADSAFALHADTGSRAWEYPLGANTGLASAASGPEGIYLLDDDGYLHLVSRSGARRARVALPDRGPSLVSTTPLVLGDQVFVNNWDAAMYAYSAAGLAERSWRYTTTDDMELRTDPAGAGHTVYLGTHNGWVLAISDADGSRHWAFHAAGPVGTPVAAGGSVIVTVGTTGLLALDAGTGAQQWYRDDGWYSTPRVSGDQVLVGHGTDIEALSLQGKRRWSTPVLVDRAVDGPAPAPGSGGGSVFTIAQQFTATGSPDTSVFTGNPQALDAATGRRRWIRTDLVASTGASYDDGRLYLGLSHPQDGGRPNAAAVACLDARTGATLWIHDTDGYATIEPLLVPDH